MALRTAARWGRTTLLAGFALASACTTGFKPASSRFPPGSVASPAGPVVIEVGNAHYREHGLSLGVVIRNTTEHEITVQREGILLAYDDLEYAVQTEVAGAPEPKRSIKPGSVASLDLSFELGRPLRQPAELMLRAVKSGDTWLDLTSVEIPAMPLPTSR